MSRARHVDADLDALIEEITVDAHDVDEQLMASRRPSTKAPPSHALRP